MIIEILLFFNIRNAKYYS